MSACQSPRQTLSPAAVRPVNATECTVCRGDTGSHKITLPTPNCTHSPEVCTECLQQVIVTAINSGEFITGILCPSPECSQKLDYYDIRKWASQIFDRYDRLLLQDSLRGDEHYVHCLEPSCTAGQEHAGGETNNIVTCHHCGTKQCFRHQVLWHEGLTCEQWDEHQRAITNQELMTDKWIQAETKPCPGPGCGKRIQKSDGCDHMVCKRPGGCGYEFCWQCFAPWLPIVAGDNSKHHNNCRYYTSPAPAEVVTARVPSQPQTLSVPGPGPMTWAHVNYVPSTTGETSESGSSMDWE